MFQPLVFARKPPGSKSSVGNSSVPQPSLKDHSATKPASAPPKSNIKPIPFKQYGSNLMDAELFPAAKACLSPVLQAEEAPSKKPAHEAPSDDAHSEEPISPEILKRQKLSEEDMKEVGWESPEDLKNDQETLAEKIAKLKSKQDREVDNPPSHKKKSGFKPKRAALRRPLQLAAAPGAKARARSTCFSRPPSGRLKRTKVLLLRPFPLIRFWFFPLSRILTFGKL
jgi:hypothetical protein